MNERFFIYLFTILYYCLSTICKWFRRRRRSNKKSEIILYSNITLTIYIHIYINSLIIWFDYWIINMSYGEIYVCVVIFIIYIPGLLNLLFYHKIQKQDIYHQVKKPHSIQQLLYMYMYAYVFMYIYIYD